VEKKHKIKKTDIPPDKFRKLCEELVDKYIGVMKEATTRLGYSMDWTTEYKTMNPDYWRRTQLSFVILYEKGFIYRGTHPVNWCPRCETAIADAEVEHDTRKAKLHYIRFNLEKGGFLTIATTRPELTGACVAVAVNPQDERYAKHIGESIHVPETDRKVKIIGDELVDPKFGTGAMMICTYGDKADVKNVSKHHLPVIQLIDEKGRMTREAGKYAGFTVDEAKKAAVENLKEESFYEKMEKIDQEVSLCWRCKTPIEILEREQWFMKTRTLTDDVEKNALEITWYPDYMKHRLIDWAKSLDWDWVISRQRVFATPIPIWYCKKCGETILAKPEWLPIDPRVETPKNLSCPNCQSRDLKPEMDVLDTWMDSSITCAVHAGWPDRKDWHRMFPADVHPSGVDIIRTWAYYLMVKHLALFNEKPYKSCLINGMVLGSDGREMHKSLGNYVSSEDVLSKYGADATRQWAAGGGATGSDIPFRWPDVEYGWRFLIKLWNASSFVGNMLKDYTHSSTSKPDLQLLDKWILSKAERLTQKVTEAFEKCQFNVALDETRNFAWHVFCDCYIEAVKDRLYKPEAYGESRKKAAQNTLHTVLRRLLQLLAPVAPHVTEEIYQAMYAETEGHKSLHVSAWQTISPNLVDEEAERRGDMVMATITEIRREKAEKHLPLNAPIKLLRIHSEDAQTADAMEEGKMDIAGTCKVAMTEISVGKTGGREVKPYNVWFEAEY